MKAQNPKTQKANPAPTALQIISNTAKIPDYPASAVKKLMARLDLNEKAFALVMNVTPMTVRLWTSGAVKPCGLSRRLMQIFSVCPEIAAQIMAGQEAE